MSVNKDGSINWIDKTNKSGAWRTAPRGLAPVRCYFGGQIPLDPATPHNNPTRARLFYTEDDDGLSKSWSLELKEAFGPVPDREHYGVFVNPPYGVANRFREWIEKIAEEAETGLPIIALLPEGSRSSTKYWQDYALVEELNAVCYPIPRLPYIALNGELQTSPPMSSHYLGYNVAPRRFANCFTPMGKTLLVEVQ